MLTLSNTLKFTALAALIALAACTTKPKSTAEEAPPVAPPAQSSGGGMRAGDVVAGSIQDFRVNVGDTVHFEYNAFNVSDDQKAILQRQATWLQRYPQVRVTIEGHCDERGTREYNLALGARRANSVKEYLVSVGVSSARVDTISYGKERPICTESNEGCWQQNRRGVTTIVSGAATS